MRHDLRFVLAGSIALVWGARSLAQHRRPFDLIEKAYAPYASVDDPLGFNIKVKALAKDRYTFWRGSKDLFYEWCARNAADWMADTAAHMPCHGDLHLGNIGSYAAAGEFGHLAFGLVDFDDSARLPFQIELLQGLITLRLTAEQNKVVLASEQSNALARAMFDAYRHAVDSDHNATTILKDNSLVNSIVAKGRASDYSEELSEYVRDDTFATAVFSNGKLKEILRPKDDLADTFARAIAQSLENSEGLKELFRLSSAEDIRSAIRSIAQRTRLGSSGSQGLRKYFVLLDRPLKSAGSPIILYLKEQIPSAAERQGIIPGNAQSPGQRCAEYMHHLTDPPPYVNSWCELDGRSYWVCLKEPWSIELSPEDFNDAGGLLEAARILGTVAGASHHDPAEIAAILPRLTGQLQALVQERTDAYLRQLQSDFADFQADPRTQEGIVAADAAIAEYDSPRNHR